MKLTTLFRRPANKIRAHDYWQKADDYWVDGDRPLALECAQKAALLDSGNPEAHLALAKFRARAGDYVGAIAGLKLAAETVSPVEAIVRQIVRLLYTLNRPEEALTLLSPLLEKDKNDHELWRLHAQLMLALGQPDKARRNAERAIEIDPKRPGGYAVLSRVLLQQGEHDLAQEQLEKAIALGGENTSLSYRLAAIYEERNRLDESWNALTRVPPDHIPAQTRRARILHARGDFEGAREAARALGRLCAESFGEISLESLFSECFKEAQTDQREPDAAMWLWSRLNQPESAKADWSLRLKWGLFVNNRINQWILANPARIDELNAIAETPDWSVLTAARAEGRTILLTGAHVGPRTLALHFLNRLDVPLGMAVGDVSYVLQYGRKPFILPRDPHSMIALREMLNTHGMLYIVADGSFGRSRYQVEFLGASGFLAEGTAALARLSGAQTFWLAARWIGSRIKLDLLPGPTPVEGESRVAWNRRFFSFYLAQLENQLRAGSENLRHATLRFIKI